ncbi:MAG: hypothetical protein ACREQ4_04005, partial [Candidatus Binataceae bacterium]
DLRAGIISLPVVLGIQHSQELHRLFGLQASLDDEGLARALNLMREPAIVARGRAMAAEQVDRARSILERLETSPYRDSLAVFIEEQADREV